MKHSVENTTRLVIGLRNGDMHAAGELLMIVYDELHRLAVSLFDRQSPSHILQPTALVHEAYLKLVDHTRLAVNDRIHFFRIAARAMRQVLIDHARSQRAAKRGRGDRIEPLMDEPGADASLAPLDLLALDDALSRLAALDERQAAVVEMRFFAGLSVDETATALGVSPRTVEMDWRMARAWLSRTLSDEP